MKRIPKIMTAALMAASLVCGGSAWAKSHGHDSHAKSAKHGKSAKPVKKLAAAKSKRKLHVVLHKAKPVVHAAPAAAVAAHHAAAKADSGPLKLASNSVLVQDQTSGAVLYQKNADAVVPIASVTKLMTAMVALDMHPNLREDLTIADSDVDTLRHSTSHVPVGTVLPREDMLRLALMSSENRAAASLARHYPGGTAAFVAAMNRKAQALGLKDTHFFDSTGLNAGNVSSARDLARMVTAASGYPLIREFTTTAAHDVKLRYGLRTFHNTNPLVKSDAWEIGVSKTGYINESGKCLVMQAWFKNKPTIIVLLDSYGKFTRQGDANRIKRWVESEAG